MGLPQTALSASISQNGQSWSIEDALELYNVPAWGSGYFSINAAGHVVVRPDTTSAHEIDLFEVVQGLAERDLSAPVVIRFSDILAHRLRRLHDAFNQAITENDYRNRYTAVYPIKVNQQRLVVEEVFRYGKEFGFGLEVGSKPELLAVMAMTEGAPERPIICNGFKDSSYIEAVMLATKLGRTIIPVIENFSELDLVLRHAEALRRSPEARCARQAGERGLGPLARVGRREIQVRPVHHRDSGAALGSAGRATCSTASSWCTAIPAASCRTSGASRRRSTSSPTSMPNSRSMGAGLEYIDIGGGLGIDYDGSGTNYPSSMNYTLQEYASDVVYRVGERL